MLFVHFLFCGLEVYWWISDVYAARPSEVSLAASLPGLLERRKTPGTKVGFIRSLVYRCIYLFSYKSKANRIPFLSPFDAKLP